MVLGFAADAVSHVSNLITDREPSMEFAHRNIENARHALKQALKYLDEIPKADEGDGI